MAAAAQIEGTTARAIVTSVESLIERGSLEPGEVLPSVRALARDLGVSPVTVTSAYKELRARGVVTTHERRRTRVSARPTVVSRGMLPLNGDVRDLASDNPDPAFLPDLGTALRKIDTPPDLYGRPPVLPAFAEIAAGELTQLEVDASHIAVVNGTFDGVERLLDAHLKQGDAVAVEDPAYTGVLDLVRALGLEPIGVPIDEEGMKPDALAKALRAGVGACVITPRAQNPLGAALTRERADQLRRVLAKHRRVLLIEDDHAGPVTSQPYFTLTADQERWAVIRSVSKFLGPDLRLAMMCGDQLTIAQVLGRQLLGSGWVSYVLQRTVVELLSDAKTVKLFEQAANAYTQRRERVIEALAARGIKALGRSGLNIWLPVPEEGSAIRNLMQLGWAATAGEIFRLSSPPGLRITTAALPEEEADRLATDVERALNPQPGTARA
jgi:DNA-binding transcriptional MocR family regulator